MLKPRVTECVCRFIHGTHHAAKVKRSDAIERVQPQNVNNPKQDRSGTSMLSVRIVVAVIHPVQPCKQYTYESRTSIWQIVFCEQHVNVESQPRGGSSALLLRVEEIAVGPPQIRLVLGKRRPSRITYSRQYAS